MEPPQKPIKSGDGEMAEPLARPSPLWKMILVASLAAGVQFGWALQLSLLTPYVQLLGIPHTWAGYIWLCGPISGMLVQPTVGYYSDRCASRFGRRRPFIAAGAALVAVAIFLIGFAADIGHASGDPITAPDHRPKIRAIAVFVVGFWILDVANNMLQGPCRALLADLAADSQSRTRTSNAFYSFFMAVGNVLGFAAGSYRHLYRVFPFSRTPACDVYCANLKSCFFISIALLVTLTTLALSLVKEKTFVPPKEDVDAPPSERVGGCSQLPFFGQMLDALKDLSRPMWILLLVTCLNWIAWFPFLLFDTDWMGKEVFGGTVGHGTNYDRGVRAGALGLMLNSVVLGVTSLLLEPLARWVGGAKRLWGIVNLMLAVCLSMTVLITKMAQHTRHLAGPVPPGHEPPPPPANITAGALALFSLLGIPLAITYSIPFALASIFSSSSGAGQGLSLGVLNLAIVVPQMFVSVTNGPWDALFGGGNLPAFVVGALAALVSAILSFTILPSPPAEAKISGTVGGH